MNPIRHPMQMAAGKAARTQWARHVLRWVLEEYVYGEPAMLDQPPADFCAMLYNALAPVAYPWGTSQGLGVGELLTAPSVPTAALETARIQLQAILTKVIRQKESCPLPPLAARPLVLAPGPLAPRYLPLAVHVPLADVLTLAVVQLLGEVAHSSIRPCRVPACPRIFVATKNQQFCHLHQPAMRRQRQRAAERAFRTRQRTAKTKTKRPTRTRRRR